MISNPPPKFNPFSPAINLATPSQGLNSLLPLCCTMELKLIVINFSTSSPPTPCIKRPLILIKANLGDIRTIGKNYNKREKKLLKAYLYFTPSSDKN
jgi:hypothetical protein